MNQTEVSGRYRVKVPGLEDYQGSAPCQSACPVGTDTKGYLRAIREGDYERAYLIARQSNPLVSVCSRVCTAPCETSCRKAEAESPVGIRALKRFACDRHGVISPPSAEKRLREISQGEAWASDRTGNHILSLSELSRKGKREGGSGTALPRVAVVGSGPAGLSAAHDLALLGYGVTIFEKEGEPGGQLRTGIPGFRLPKEILRREIAAIEGLGVEIRVNSSIGVERSIADLRKDGFEAVFIAIGLQNPMPLKLEGVELEGVHSGIDYVRQYERIPTGKTCLVIGGGGVAIDCAQHAVRQGAERVLIACLESWETMPASLAEREDAREEGIEFFPSLGPRRIIGSQGRVVGVEFLKVSSVFDVEGKFNPSFISGSDTVLKVDTVILAIGQASTLSSLPGMRELESTPAGLIAAGEDMSTGLPGIFAGGDIRWRSGRSATEAIADGQKGARAIHSYLSGQALRVKKRGVLRSLPREFENTGCDAIGPAEAPKRAASERIRSREEISLAYEEEQARLQAARCRRCNLQILFDRSRCLLCGTCVDTCVNRALKVVRVADIRGDGKIEKLVGATPAAGKTAIIKDENRCARCGMCARRCPGQALIMAEFHLEEDWE